MSVYLLDANVLIALAWPDHVLHDRVMRWFGKRADQGWATCPLTQAAFVRVVSDPAFAHGGFLSPVRALELLQRNLAHPNHQFWPLDITLSQAVRLSGATPRGNKQITDIYILGLAIHRKGLLATCDEGIPAWGSPGKSDRQFIEMIR
jgi:toxin-antitoxin system PIN domain toxin